MSNNNNANYFLKLLELVNPNTVNVNGSNYICVGSSYAYHSKPSISPLSAILKGKIMMGTSISAKCKNGLGCSFDGDDLLTKYLSRAGVVPEIVEIEDKIQKIFDDNTPKEKTIDIEVAKKIAPDYKKEQEKIRNIVSSQTGFEFEGGGNLKIDVKYDAANIYGWKRENFGFAAVSLTAHLNPETVIPENITESSLAEFACNSPPDDFDISVEGFGDIQKNEDKFNIFLKKI